MLSGDNGLLKRATDAKTDTDNAQIKERIQLAYHSALTGGQGSYSKESLEQELEKEFGKNNYSVDDSDNTNWILSAKGQDVTIPAGVKGEQKAATIVGRQFYQGGNLYKAYGWIITDITAIKKSSSQPTDTILSDSNHIWSTDSSEYDVYFWIDNNIMYWWSEANHIFFSEDCNSIFSGWSSLKDISGLKDFDTSNVTDMKWMFSGTALEGSIDISKWNTSKVTNMDAMFSGCSNLSTIYASDKFVTTALTVTNNAMFNNCTSLVGGNETHFNDSKKDESMAKIDTAVYENGTLVSGTPGYFTAK